MHFGNLGRQIATGENELFIFVKQAIEGERQLNLGAVFSGKKMNILQEKHIASLSVFRFKLINGIVSVTIDHFIGEIFSRHVVNPLRGKLRQYKMSDGLGQVTFAHTGLR